MTHDREIEEESDSTLESQISNLERGAEKMIRDRETHH